MKQPDKKFGIRFYSTLGYFHMGIGSIVVGVEINRESITLSFLVWHLSIGMFDVVEYE